MPKHIPPLLFAGLLGTLVIGSHFATQYGRAAWGNQEIWWTPRAMALSLDDTRQEFELLVSGELLQRHLARHSLAVVAADGTTSPLTTADIRVRLNNWHKIKASFLNDALLAAFLLGVSVTCLILGAIPLLAGNKKKPPPAE